MIRFETERIETLKYRKRGDAQCVTMTRICALRALTAPLAA